ncbi:MULTISPECIES: hypothetical protein [Mesonia]|uniref:Uncharacterized protein n=1 Tax=Mesonia oceanica TaxID=2687242 RepID=A0AC61YDQ1_9FLAO|nr:MULTISPECIES: hypothetical protein [Mesonia]MAN26429.1 hypothetical protein [Mesonia sp.]MAQ39569.1 hypothetical protein [Mesonia sp.]MBJ99158.1 hypothetical protein [Flavobacteriaceae bacterium]VVV02410.1 hypothetical protein FVB9532_03709 [Mesonia oceanica]|tara:strand:- start:9534 stop:10169 length:636 start_codon:yes stop_codon:yes gene_type:complete
MNNLIKEALDEYFSDFKKYHLIILIAFTVIIALIQVIQSILVSKKIEKFKNELKKSEIKFSKYNQLQVQALNELYPILSELLIYTASVEIELKKASPEKLNLLLEDWGKAFAKVIENYILKRYILPNNIKKEFGKLTGILDEVNAYVRAEKKMSSLFATINNKVEFMGKDKEREEISDELIKLKKDGLVYDSMIEINKLQSEIENYFESIE